MLSQAQVDLLIQWIGQIEPQANVILANDRVEP
jgi:hypothetical protein